MAAKKKASPILRLVTKPYFYVPLALLLIWAGIAVAADADSEGAFEMLSVPLLLAAVAINLLALPLWSLRTRIVFQSLGHPVSFSSLLRLTAFGNVGNQILPAGGGEIAKGAFLAKLHGVPATTAAALLYERLLGFLLLSATAAAAIVGSALRVAGRCRSTVCRAWSGWGRCLGAQQGESPAGVDG